MITPAQALQSLDGLLSRARRGQLDLAATLEMVDLLRLVPGYAKSVAHALSAQRNAAAVQALMVMPPNVPGVVEGLHQAFHQGVARVRRDGSACPPMFAMDFRRSKSRRFVDVLTRAQALFGDELVPLRVEGKLLYRFVVWGNRGTLAGRAAAASHDLRWLHEQLARLKGTRLWLNGWCFPAEGAIRAAVQVHLVRAWLGWAASQTSTVVSR